MRRLRIGIDFHTWDGIYQGSRSHLWSLYQQVIPAAPDVDFVFFLDGTDSLRDSHPAFDAPNVQLVRMRHSPGFFRLGVQLPWLRWQHDIDLLHMQYRLPLLPFGPCACTLHDVLFETHPEFFPSSFVWQSRLTCRQAARHAEVLFTVSRYSRDEIARLYGVAPESITVTANGVDTQRFHPGDEGIDAVRRLGLQPGHYVLTVGRLEPRKNHLTLLAAHARLPYAPPLVIVGQRDFGYTELLDQLAGPLAQGRVLLIDRVDDATLPAVMRHAQVFTYPAHAEGFGMPVLEAMASGVPVVTSSTTSLPEVAGSAALLVDPRSVDGWSDALAQVIGDASLQQSMRERGLAQVGAFSWGHSAAVLLDRLRAWGAARAGIRPALP
ncbi:MAG: glycosyltransferase family 4 protein [Burkholderiales bacterium]|nr:glycosyltransferase family 4 protein [Burkholderiales bacterium]MCH2240790.1 glycosyltransferase family 4 protein [Aquabacterium sp.]